MARLVHVVAVKVPVEACLALTGHEREEPLLHLLQQIEAHEEIVVVAERDVLALCHLAVECALVGQRALFQQLVVVVIDVAHVRPELEEPVLEHAVVVVREVTEEFSEHLFLCVSEIADVIQFVNVAQVGKHLVGIGHVLVYVVEVSEQQLSPSVEVVEGLVDARLAYERLVQQAYQLYGVADDTVGVLPEQVADGDVGRTPDGLVHHLGEVLVEEECSSLVGEDDGHLAQVGAVLAYDVFSYVF